ncbi:MAG: response regulator transcription factor, partial [Bacteroidetes bacterium]|nr:response regulator transcription factor [Bacteroidota bacterium]
LPNPPLAILTTAYAEYALESYEFSIIDYLLKPISFERFSKAINKITNGRLYTQFTADRNPDANDHIFVKSGNKFFRVNFSEIIYIEAMKDYLRIHANEYKIVTLQTMSEMEKLLPSKQFLRIHKSFIVATTHIKSVYGSTVETAKATLPIGLNYKNNVMSFISGR